MSVEKDACMAETLSSVEPECSQTMRKRKKKQLEETHCSSGEPMANDSGVKNNHVDKAGLDDDSPKDSDRTRVKEAVSLKEGVKKKKKHKKMDSTQPTVLLSSQEEEQIENMQNISRDALADISATGNTFGESVKYVSEAGVDTKLEIDSNTVTETSTIQEEGKKRKKRKKDMYSIQSAEQLEKIESISSDSQDFNSAAKDAACQTVNRDEENEVDAESKKKLKTTQAIESTSFHEGRTEKKKRKKDLRIDESSSLATKSSTFLKGEKKKKKTKQKEDLNCSLSRELIDSQEKGTLERTLADITERKNTIGGKYSCIDETIIDASTAEDLNSSKTGDLAALQEERKEKKKQKKDLNSSNTSELVASQEESKEKKKQKIDSSSSNTGDLFASQEERKEKKKQRKNLSGSSTSDPVASQEERREKKRQKKDLNSSALKDERKEKKKQEDLNCLETIQLPTSEEEEEQKRKKKRKKISNSSQPTELHVSKEEERCKRTQNVRTDLESGLTANDNRFRGKGSCIDETDIDNNKKIDANRCQATESNGPQEKGKKRKKRKRGLRRLEPSLEEDNKMKQNNFLDGAVLPLQEGGRDMIIEMNTDSGCYDSKATDIPIEKDLIPHALTAPIRRPDVLAAKKLLILDVNGLLADLVLHSERPAGRQPDLYLRGKSVYKRPYCEDFIRFCFKNFEVGVWSSRTRKNLDGVVKFLFKRTKGNLLFCWDRSHCTITGLNTVEDQKKPLVLKELHRLWSDPHIAREAFDASNTLLLDDSPYKALRNPVHTAVFPRSYKCTDTDDSALGPEGDLRKYLERLATAPNVQEFVSQNPFGQGPITASDPDWPFYRKIIARLDSSNSSSSQRRIEIPKPNNANRRQQQHVRFV
ncbi:hypothetical protein LINPERHAP1_LOCUS35912 [Linum perenne]